MRLSSFGSGDKDVGAAHAVARSRVLTATALALVLYVTAGEETHTAFQYVVAFAFVPGSVALALAAERLRPAALAVGGAALESVVVIAAIATFEQSAELLTTAMVLPVLIAAYTGGIVVGVLAATAAVVALVVGTATDAFVVRGTLVPFVALGSMIVVALAARGDVVRGRYATRAQRSTDRANAVLDQAPGPIAVTSSSGLVLQMNPAAHRLFAPPDGASTCSAALRIEVEGRLLECSQSCGLASLRAARNGGLEAQHRRADGTCVPVWATVAEIASPSADGAEVIHTFQDITSLKRADEAKTLFLATATHELKTPLTVIRGFLDAISNPKADGELRDAALPIMRDRADELGRIIERLLLASRIESGRVAVHISEIDVVSVARDRVDALARATGRTIAFTSSEAPPVCGDESALATVVDHLIENACKYSPPDTAIDVSVVAGDTTVTLVVRDRGVGMSEDTAAHCFERFWQADASARRAVGGTGIGLYIVRSLVEAMGGQVTVDSTIDVGSAFSVELQRADAQPRSFSEDEAVASDSPPEPSIVREFMRQIGVPTRSAR